MLIHCAGAALVWLGQKIKPVHKQGSEFQICGPKPAYNLKHIFQCELHNSRIQRRADLAKLG